MSEEIEKEEVGIIKIGSGNPNPLDPAIVGVIENNGYPVLCYDEEKLVECFMEDNDWDWETAAEWVSYNTIRSLPYEGPRAPLILNRIPEEYDNVDEYIEERYQ